MAFIVETGAGLHTATSYVSLSYSNQYFALNPTSGWADLDNSVKEQALIDATAAIDLLYGQMYKGQPLTDEQALLFPRTSIRINKSQRVEAGSIPVQLKKAVCEVALKAVQGEDIYPDVNEASTLRSKSTTLDTLSKSVVYDTSPTNEMYTGFYKIDLILKPILDNGDAWMPPYLGR